MAPGGPRPRRGSLVVFAPSPVLAITVESGGEAAALHLHGGGQGYWCAHMAAELADVTLCCPLGGETGQVLDGLIEGSGVRLRAVRVAGETGAYIHDQDGPRRTVLRRIPSVPLGRHEVDDLYDLTLTAALEAGALLLTGPRDPGLIAGDVYRRLAEDVTRAGVPVLADLTGPALAGALAGGVDVLKINDEQAVGAGFAAIRSRADLLVALSRMRAAGARNAVISRGPKGALGLIGDDLLRLSAPRFSAPEPRGTGDSMFAGLGAGVASGASWTETLRLGMAAGCLNATRHGLGTGHRRDVEQLLGRTRVERIGEAIPAPGDVEPWAGPVATGGSGW